jgi:hypothetical protein
VDADQVAVLGETDVTLEGVGALGQRTLVRVQGVLRGVVGRSAVRDDLDT